MKRPRTISTLGTRVLRGLAAAIACVLLNAQALASLDGPVVMLDESLTERVVEIISIDDGVVRYRDIASQGRGPVTAIDQERVVALFAVPTVQETSSLLKRGVLTLTDGRRFVGMPTVAPADAPSESAAWQHDVFGSLTVPIEQVRSLENVRLGDSPGPEAPAELLDDTITFTNGDRITGLLLDVADTVRWEDDSGERSIRVDFVSRIDALNPPTEPEGVSVWLDDGSIVRADVVTLDQSHAATIELHSADESASMTSEIPSSADDQASARTHAVDLHGIVFDAARLMPLSEISPDNVQPLSDFPGASGLAIDNSNTQRDARAHLGSDIRFNGPLDVRWALPEGTSRVSFIAELPRRARMWGRGVLVVDTGTRQRQRIELSAEHPSVPIALSVSPDERTLRVRLEPGDGGPVQDSVVLRNALLLR